MKKKINTLILLLITTLLTADSDFRFGSDQMTYSFSEHNKRSILTGNAFMISDDTEIHADRIEMYGEDSRFSECEGNVEVENKKEEYTLTCEKLIYDRVEKISTMNGNAVMQDMKNEMVIKGSYIKNYEETSVTIIQINVRIIKKDMACRSEFARYDKNSNTLELTGMPIVYKNNDTFKASKIIINLDNDEITMEGKVQGNIQNEEKKTESPEAEEAEGTEKEESDEA